MKKLIVLITFIVMAVTSRAVMTVERTVKAQGPSRDTAVKQALYEAVAQVQGVAVSTGVARSGAYVANYNIDRQEVNKSVEMEGISVDAVNSITMTQAEGMVKSYEVTDEQTLGDGKVEVTVKAQVYDYESPLSSGKLTLAVTAFGIDNDAHVFGDIKISGSELSKQFAQRLSTLILDSGRFNILDRAYTAEFEQEMAILKSDDAGVEEKSRLKNVLGADYLLSGRIQRATIQTEYRDLPSTGMKTEEYRGYFDAEVRLLVPATREVAFSHEYRIKLKTNDVKALADEWKRDERDFNQIRKAFMDIAARRIIEDVLNDVYPVRVAVAEPGQIILDQGGQRVRPNVRYEVFQAGQAVLDPVTQGVLGKAQNRIATLQITQILPRFSYARVLEGNASAIQVGQMCRIHPDENITIVEPQGGMKSKIERTPSGGVRMPFD